MTIPLLPPKSEPVVDNNKFATLNWLVFFDEVALGDLGTAWTPTFVGLTEVGTATKTGIYYRISQRLTFFRIVITPGTNTSAVSGTTYCNNFPLNMISDGFSISCSGSTAGVAGSTYSDRRIYTSTWTNITTPITIVGIAEVQ